MIPQHVSTLIADLGGLLFQGYALHLLVAYSLKRKFRNEKPGSWTIRGMIDRWRIELIFAAVLVPQWADWLPKLLARVVGGPTP